MGITVRSKTTVSILDTLVFFDEVIKDYDDNICYGYAGQRDCAMFKDFKRLVMDCIDTGTIMKWW